VKRRVWSEAVLALVVLGLFVLGVFALTVVLVRVLVGGLSATLAFAELVPW